MRRPIWVLLVILVLVAALWYLLKDGEISLRAPFSGTATPTLLTGQFLYTEDQGSISGIKVEDGQGRAVEIRRGAAGSWSLLQPETAFADPARTQGAATQSAALRILAELEGSVDPQVIGLATPAYTITLQTASGDHIFLVGNRTVTGSGYYVRTPEGKIVVVTTFGMDALTSLLGTPPFAETPTASPAATLAPTRTLGPVVTP